MAPTDLALVALHAVFYAPFVGRALVRVATTSGSGAAAPGAEPLVARGAAAMVLAHAAAFGVLYLGVASALFGPFRFRLGNAAVVVRSIGPFVLPYQAAIGAAMTVLAIGLAYWTLFVFRSWRFAAAIEKGHTLSTDGPFRFVRHPIYAALDLLALGALVWLPTVAVAVGALAIALVGDFRARAEEALLVAAFGDDYRDYRKRVARFVPGVY